MGRGLCPWILGTWTWSLVLGSTVPKAAHTRRRDAAEWRRVKGLQAERTEDREAAALASGMSEKSRRGLRGGDGA